MTRRRRDDTSSGSDESSSYSDTSESSDNHFKPPERYLFSRKKLKQMLTFDDLDVTVGSGLNNLGNTCFLNSVLQVLAYTPPLVHYAFFENHAKSCRVSSFCALCEVVTMITKMHNAASSAPRSPKSIVNNVNRLGGNFRRGRQEDAQEFLRYLVEAMNSNYISSRVPREKVDFKTQHTGFVNAIFGGYLQSTVTCHNCEHESNVFDPFLDLSLDIGHSSSISKALQRFTAPEHLDKANQYRCEKCKRHVSATKQFMIYKAPVVLALHLKRFSGYRKINNFVYFPPQLTLEPYLTNAPEVTRHPGYRLYAVITHAGSSMHAGHYYSCIKGGDNRWYLMNDGTVRGIREEQVLSQSAYMLFYIKERTLRRKMSIRSPARSHRRASDSEKEWYRPVVSAVGSVSRMFRGSDSESGSGRDSDDSEGYNGNDSSYETTDTETSSTSGTHASDYTTGKSSTNVIVKHGDGRRRALRIAAVLFLLTAIIVGLVLVIVLVIA